MVDVLIAREAYLGSQHDLLGGRCTNGGGGAKQCALRWHARASRLQRSLFQLATGQRVPSSASALTPVAPRAASAQPPQPPFLHPTLHVTFGNEISGMQMRSYRRQHSRSLASHAMSDI
jgi:hypothetical protein